MNSRQWHWFGVTRPPLLTQTAGSGAFAPGTQFTYDSEVYIDHLSYLITAVTGEASALRAKPRCVWSPNPSVYTPYFAPSPLGGEWREQDADRSERSCCMR